MKRHSIKPFLFLALLISCFILGTSYAREEPQDRKKEELKEKLKKLKQRSKDGSKIDLERIYKDAQIAREKAFEELLEEGIEIDLSELENDMMYLHEELANIEVDLPYVLADIEVPFVEMPIVDVPHFEMPDFDVPTPLMPDFPEEFMENFIEVEHLSHMPVFIGGMGFSDKYMTDEEQLRVEMVRGLRHMNTEKALSGLSDILRNDNSPAVRMAAIRIMRYVMDHEDALPLLGEVAQNDSDLRIRRVAVKLLGSSKDPRAADYLESLLK